MRKLTKPQKQLLVGNGFMAGLAELGVREIDSSNMALEGPFLKAWRQWSAGVPSEITPKVEFGGTEQPRMILFRLGSSNSVFKDFKNSGIPAEPMGMPPREYLEIWCDELAPDKWVELAQLFLEAQGE